MKTPTRPSSLRSGPPKRSAREGRVLGLDEPVGVIDDPIGVDAYVIRHHVGREADPPRCHAR